MNYEYTRIMKQLVTLHTTKYSSYYSREYVQTALEGVKKAGKASRLFRMREFQDICSVFDIDARELLRDSSLLMRIPDTQQIGDSLCQDFYDMYRLFPTGEDYMTRIVRRLAPEYSEDTVRTAILKKFMIGSKKKIGQFDTQAVADWAYQQLSEEEQKACNSLADVQQRAMLTNRISDAVFTPERLRPVLTNAEKLAILIRRLQMLRGVGIIGEGEEKTVFTDAVLSQQASKAVADELAAEGKTVPEQKPVLDVLAELAGLMNERGAIPEPLFICLDTELRAQLNCLRYINRNQQEASARELYKNDLADERSRKKQWAILELCDDLASGKFKNNGGLEKVYLYYFAFMFDMTAEPDENRRKLDEKDLVTNLFEDYYCDNVMRYLQAKYSDPDYTRGLEKEPSGAGINFKNYAETIYLYYLMHRELYQKPAEGIAKAEKMINQCISAAKKKRKDEELENHTVPDGSPKPTKEFRQDFIDVVFSADEESLADLIVRRYRILDESNTRIGVAAQSVTAHRDVFRMVSSIDEANNVDSRAFDADIAETDYCITNENDKHVRDGLKELASELMLDEKISLGRFAPWTLGSVLKTKYENDQGFIRLVDVIEERIATNLTMLLSYNRRLLRHIISCLWQEASAAGQNMTATVSNYKLRKYLRDLQLACTDEELTAALDVLADIGLHIVHKGGETVFTVTPYSGALDDLMKAAAGGFPDSMTADAVLLRLIQDSFSAKKRISRSTFLSVCACYYMALLDDTDTFEYGQVRHGSFAHIFRCFCEAVNPRLRAAGFQTISEKNILDMYIVFSVYYNIINNH